jgi:hypothetical protein
MKKQIYTRLFKMGHIGILISGLLLVSAGIAFAAGEGVLQNGDITTDGLTVINSTKTTTTEIKKDVDWSEYTTYQITKAQVSFRNNWMQDYNKDQQSLSTQITEREMLRIRTTMANIFYEELDRSLKKNSSMLKTDVVDSGTLLFKPRIINLDIYAPDVLGSGIKNYVRQAGKVTLFLEVYDAVSGELLGRWVDTREDPDRGYFDWANRFTNEDRMRLVIRRWADRLVEGLGLIQAGK